MELIVIWFHVKWLYSPDANETISAVNPAPIIWKLALMVVLPFVTEYFEYKEPVAHKTVPHINAKKLMSCILSPRKLIEPLFRESNTMPASPMINPMMINLSEKFSFQCFLSSITNQKGVLAIIIEHNPAGKYCSTQMRVVVPKNNINIPPNEFFKTEIVSGIFSPLKMHQINKMMPATKKRMAAIKNGGVLFIASAMAI